MAGLEALSRFSMEERLAKQASAAHKMPEAGANGSEHKGAAEASEAGDSAELKAAANNPLISADIRKHINAETPSIAKDKATASKVVDGVLGKKTGSVASAKHVSKDEFKKLAAESADNAKRLAGIADDAKLEVSRLEAQIAKAKDIADPAERKTKLSMLETNLESAQAKQAQSEYMAARESQKSYVAGELKAARRGSFSRLVNSMSKDTRTNIKTFGGIGMGGLMVLGMVPMLLHPMQSLGIGSGSSSSGGDSAADPMATDPYAGAQQTSSGGYAQQPY